MEKEQEKSMMSKPKVNSSAQRELDKAEEKFDKYQEDLKSLSYEDARKAPILEEEKQTKLSSIEQQKSGDIYLKPSRTLSDNQKFNEKWQKEWEYRSQYVKFIAEHRELIGEKIEVWTHPYGGKGASFWEVPTNKPVWGPRYLADQIKNCIYIRYVTSDHKTSIDGQGTYYGSLVATNRINRIDAYPVVEHKSIHMGESSF